MFSTLHRDDPAPVSLAARNDGLLELVLADARAAAGRLEPALQLADRLGPQIPVPGQGDTALTWSVLATLGAADLTVARAVEPHLDAVAIVTQARQAGVLAEQRSLPTGRYGVFAAEGPGTRLEVCGDVLRGTKPWCSLAHRLDAALVTAWEGDRRSLLAVDLHQPGVHVEDGSWVSRGLAAVTSPPVRFDEVPAVPVGPPGWYLDRPGFAWGGVGVAAVWFGAAVSLAARLRPRPGSRAPDQIAYLHLGEAEMALASAAAVLAGTAELADSRPVPARRMQVAALTARGAVARVCSRLISRVGRATGPAPLTGDEEHARRVADLQVYLRQEHAERDAAALGRLLGPDD